MKFKVMKEIHKRGKLVGTISLMIPERKMVYLSRRRESYHKFNKYGSYGIDKDILFMLRREFINTIVLDIDRYKLLFSSVSQWFTQGNEINYGYGPQIQLREKEMIPHNYKLMEEMWGKFTKKEEMLCEDIGK